MTYIGVSVVSSSEIFPRLSGELASVLDSIPLSMQRKFPELTGRQLAYLKELVAKGANKCVESAEKMKEFADEYYRNTDE
ncbi:TPA: DNA packaging protein [Escherichia coli]|nr:DNA packaging protein [Escherichia coli]HAJ7216582.1 DNA packaging protein [Escherichia coli]